MGADWHGAERNGVERTGLEGRVNAGIGTARQGRDRIGKDRTGRERHGQERIGMAVYIIKNSSGHYKIGFSSNSEKGVINRKKQGQTWNSENIVVIGVLPDADETVESYWQMKFAHKRTRGNGKSEWFELDQADIDRILGDEYEQNNFRPCGANNNTDGFCPSDVRPICGGHQDSTTPREQALFYAGREDDLHSVNEYNVISLSKKHDIYHKGHWWEVME